MRDRAGLQDMCLAHHGFTLPADLAGDLERITPDELLAEQLDPKRSQESRLTQRHVVAHCHDLRRHTLRRDSGAVIASPDFS